jgi:two-component system sensor kinase FixL
VVPRILSIRPEADGGTAIDTPATAPSVSDARLSSVLDTAVDGIIVIDEQSQILRFNKACEQLFGYSAQEMLCRDIKAIMPRDYALAHDKYVADYVRTGVKKIIGIGREVAGRHRDGTVFPVELSVGEAITTDGRQFIGILRDLRPRREAEQRLNQLQADLLRIARISAIDEMGAALAHELNQPLTALMLYLQAVQRAAAKQASGAALPETAIGILDKARHEAERAGKIIQRMRHFVEKRDPVRRLVDLPPLIDDAVELTLLGRSGDVQLVRDLAPVLPPVEVDPVQIQQVLVNLLRNALDAAKAAKPPRIRISIHPDGGQVVLKVEDNGPGIAPEAVSSLFQAFSSSKTSGMGIGLAISKSLAQAHGGDLTVDPGGKGRGACFALHLPLSRTRS